MSTKKHSKESSKNSKKTAAPKASHAADAPAPDNTPEAKPTSAKTEGDNSADGKNNHANATDTDKKQTHSADTATDTAADTANNADTAQNTPSDGDKNTKSPGDPLAAYTMEELRDLYLRALADKENILRRAETEIKKARDFALDKFAPGICEVCDCLQVAMKDISTDGDKKIHEGVSLTLRKLSAVMEANGLRPVQPDMGASFDPALHQAIGIDSSGKQPANTIAAVIQPGYTLNGRVVRPAGVMVSKPGDKTAS